MSPWRRIDYQHMTPLMRRTLRTLNRRWFTVWILSVALSGWAWHQADKAADAQHASDVRAAQAQHRNDVRAAKAQREGRRDAILAFCEIDKVIIDEGKRALRSGGQALPPRVEALLRRYGYPPLSVRQANAEASAHRYEERITDAVRKAAGAKPVKGGALNCSALLERTTTP